MTEYQPPPTPPSYPTAPLTPLSQQPYPPQRKRRWGVPSAIVGAALVMLIAGVAIGSGSKAKAKDVAGPTVRITTQLTTTATATVKVTTTPTKVIATHTQVITKTYTPPVKIAFSDGTYRVGSEIRPGTYHTEGGSCYWERDRNSSDPLNKIIDNDNITGPTTIDIQSGDYAFTSSGGCDWTRVG